MTEEKKIKVEFAPGAFDTFEGTQEELNEMIAELTTLFTELTPEELEARSQSIDITDLISDDLLSKEEFEQILKAVSSNGGRTLQ